MPWSRILSFTDPLPYQAAIRAADVELYPTSRGEFRAELTQINLNQLWMQRFDEKLPQVYASKVKLGRKVIGFLTSANQPPFQHSGMNISPHDIVVSSNDVMHHRTAGDCHFGAMSLTTDDFDAAHSAIMGREFSGSPSKHLVRPSAALMARLINLHGIVGQIARTAPDILTFPEVARALEHELIHLMIRCLAEGNSFGMTAGGRRHDLIIARFEEFLEANPDQPLYLTEICAAIGVAERTLRSACEEHLGMGRSAIFRCGECIWCAAHFCALIPRRLPSHGLPPITAFGSLVASRSPIAPCLASLPRSRCVGLGMIGPNFSIVRRRWRPPPFGKLVVRGFMTRRPAGFA